MSATVIVTINTDRMPIDVAPAEVARSLSEAAARVAQCTQLKPGDSRPLWDRYGNRVGQIEVR